MEAAQTKPKIECFCRINVAGGGTSLGKNKIKIFNVFEQQMKHFISAWSCGIALWRLEKNALVEFGCHSLVLYCIVNCTEIEFWGCLNENSTK